MGTVREATYQLLRSLGMTTVFGNPGSTEEPFLHDFPDDFSYVLALQEASAVAMADGYAQATGRPAHVNLHTAPGAGNGMGGLVTAWHNKSPLVVTVGQQTREMLLIEPRLTNLRAVELARPYVKWSYEPVRAQDIPAALMRAYATAVQPPAGPVLLSLPLDDWHHEAEGEPVVREVSTRYAPDPQRLRHFADVLDGSRNPVLVVGPGVDRAGGWTAAAELAEKLAAPVWSSPAPERVGYAQDHPRFQGVLPYAIGPLAERLRGHDTVLVLGAPVFRYYPYVPGEYLPPGAHLLQITDDPEEAARAPVGESLLGDPGLAAAALAALLAPVDRPPTPRRPDPPPAPAEQPLSADALFATLARNWPPDGVLVHESPSNLAALRRHLRISHPLSYFSAASGGLGFGVPAAAGIALAERHTGRGRPVVAVVGDGAFQYSVQALWTAARHRLPVVYLVPVNGEYAVLKSFARLTATSGLPGLDLPGLDIPAIARGFGCRAEWVESADDLGEALRSALRGTEPVVLAVPISTDVPPIL